MAGSILSSLRSKPTFSIAKATGGVVMSGCRIKRVQIQLQSMLPKHMREDGSTLTDARFIRPTVLMIEVIAPTIDDADSAISVMNDRDNLYTITSKGLVFQSMLAQGTGIKHNAEMLSAMPFQMTFKQLLQQNVNPVLCAQGGDSDNQDGGIQLLSSAKSTVQTLAGRALGTISSLFGS